MTDMNIALWASIGMLFLLVMYLIISMMRLSKKREMEERRALEARETRKRKDAQRNLGNRIANALRRARAKNPHGRLVLEVLPENGKTYSIVVGWRDDSSFTLGGTFYRGYPVLQVNIGMDLKVSVSWGPYPRTWEFDGKNEGSVEVFLRNTSKKLASYSPYPRKTSVA